MVTQSVSAPCKTIIKMAVHPSILLSIFLLTAAQARSVQEIRLFFIKQAMECSEQYPVTGEEMQMMKDHKIPETGNSKCLLSCVFKKIKWMDDLGNFDSASADASIEKEHIEDTSKLENSKKLMERCKKVNEETVSDGSKGCERAALLTKCFIENSAMFGLKIQ